MGFQFPSITRMSSSTHSEKGYVSDITLLWGTNVIVRVIGTVLAADVMDGHRLKLKLLIACGLYLGALGSAMIASKLNRKETADQKITE